MRGTSDSDCQVSMKVAVAGRSLNKRPPSHTAGRPHIFLTYKQTQSFSFLALPDVFSQLGLKARTLGGGAA